MGTVIPTDVRIDGLESAIQPKTTSGAIPRRCGIGASAVSVTGRGG